MSAQVPSVEASGAAAVLDTGETVPVVMLPVDAVDRLVYSHVWS